MSEHIFVYCDDASHASKLVAVANCRHFTDGIWRVQPVDRSSKQAILTFDPGGELGWFQPEKDDDLSWSDDTAGWARSRHKLSCRKCRSPVTVREENLFPALNKLMADGEFRVSLDRLAAMLRLQSDGT